MWMCDTVLEHLSGWPIDKSSRWLGFIQGVLATRSQIDVAVEREFPQPLFHAAYQDMAMPCPPT
jgi:hypothetical protein